MVVAVLFILAGSVFSSARQTALIVPSSLSNGLKGPGAWFRATRFSPRMLIIRLRMISPSAPNCAASPVFLTSRFTLAVNSLGEVIREPALFSPQKNIAGFAQIIPPAGYFPKRSLVFACAPLRARNYAGGFSFPSSAYMAIACDLPFTFTCPRSLAAYRSFAFPSVHPLTIILVWNRLTLVRP